MVTHMRNCRFARFTGILLALLAAAQLCMPAVALAEQSGDFTYTAGSGSVIITGYKGRGGEVAIPAQIAGRTVTAIGENAFKDCKSITKVTIPGGVAAIGGGAFSGCTELAAVQLSDGLETIGTSAFDGCKKLGVITIPSSVIDAGKSTFDGCTALSAIQVASGNTTYQSVDGVLYDRSGIELIRCPEGRKGTFEIPGGVGVIADWAFSGCAGLTGITIPEGVFYIGTGAFVCGPAWAMNGGEATNAVSSLKSISVDAKNPSYNSRGGALYGEAGSRLIAVPQGITGGFSIPNGVRTVDSFALACCTALTAVTLPETVSVIGHSAFSYCALIKTVTLPQGVTYIGEEAFYGCSALTSAYTATAPAGMGTGAFGETAKDFKIYYHASVAKQWDSFNTYAKQEYCTVTTDRMDGSALTRKLTEITDGKLTAPTEPKRAGFSFGGWYHDAALKTVWDFAKDEITSDVMLYAKWVTAAPAALRAASASYKSISLRWGAVQGVTGYEVYRASSSSGSYSLLATTASTSWINGGLTAGKTYYYRIRAYRLNGSEKEYGAYSSVAAARPAPGTPKPKAASSSGSVALTWKAVAGASGYEVRRCDTSASGTYALLVSVKSPACTDKGVTAGSTYWYKVRAYRVVSGKKVYGPYSGAVSGKP